jgi:(p)ppGpp synthase/HD superfamily hydrolase
MPTIEDTIAFIKSAHAGQVDKGGVEYWMHPVSVMHRLGPDASDECRLVALLHDVIEDTRYTAEDLRTMGYPEGVIASVQRLTKPKGTPYLDCIRAIAASGDRMAMAVKRADNQDNLDPERLSKLPRETRSGDEKYRRSIEILTAVLDGESCGPSGACRDGGLAGDG